MDIVENLLRELIDLPWSVAASLYLLFRHPRTAARLLCQRLDDSRIPQVGPNTLLCICLAPLAEMVDLTNLLGPDWQPSLWEWVTSRVRGEPSDGSPPYIVLKALFFGIAISIVIDISARLIYRRLPANELTANIAQLKYSLCLPALFSWVLIGLGYYVPMIIGQRADLSAKGFAFGFTVLVCTASALLLISALLGWVVWKGGASTFVGGAGLVLLLPLASCIANMSQPGWSDEELLQTFSLRSEPRLRTPLTAEISCLLEQDTFVADVVFFNPYPTPLEMNGMAEVQLERKENEHSYSRIGSYFVVIHSAPVSSEANQIVIAPRGETAVRFKAFSSGGLNAPPTAIDKSGTYVCRISHNIANDLRVLNEKGRYVRLDDKVAWLGEGPLFFPQASADRKGQP